VIGFGFGFGAGLKPAGMECFGRIGEVGEEGRDRLLAVKGTEDMLPPYFRP
jgi:hypothetical protein